MDRAGDEKNIQLNIHGNYLCVLVLRYFILLVEVFQFFYNKHIFYHNEKRVFFNWMCLDEEIGAKIKIGKLMKLGLWLLHCMMSCTVARNAYKFSDALLCSLSKPQTLLAMGHRTV